MPFIFISYRRGDSDHVTDRIYEIVCQRFGENEVFKDIDNIPLGSDFRYVIEEAIARSDVVLAVIGDRWLEIKNQEGRRQLEIEDDFVRIEIESALNRGITVVPLLVGRLPMPKPDALVPSLRRLAYRDGMMVRAGRDFKHDMATLTRALEKIRGARQPFAGSGVTARGGRGPVRRPQIPCHGRGAT